MDLEQLTNEQLHSQTQFVFAREREIMVNGILHLRENERRMLYARMGYPDLKSYCVKELRTSESGAWRRIHAMRLLREFPELALKLGAGALKLCQLNEASSLFNRIQIPAQTKLEILSKIECKTLFETQTILAQHGPPDPRDECEEHPVKSGVRLSIRLDQDILEQWAEFEIYYGRKLSRQELLNVITSIALKVVKKAAERNHRETKKSNGVSRADRSATLRRSGHRCEFVSPDGKRCEARLHLQVDHIIPVAKGGPNDLGNYQTLCPSHNRLRALDDFGREKMRSYMPSLH